MIKAILCALAASTVSIMSPIINWGLQHHGNEVPPTASAAAIEILRKYGGLHRQDTAEKVAYFTFDLGYEAGHTAEVLDILKQNNIKGIFFLCGNYLQETEIIDRMIAEGHTIGNHTDRHKDLPVLSDQAVTADIMTFQNEFTEKFPTAVPPTWFRPPQGRLNEKVVSIAKDNNLKTLLWSIAIRDWSKSPIDAQKSANLISSRIHPGAVILMHITNSGTPKMIQKLIPMLQQKGYSIGAPENL